MVPVTALPRSQNRCCTKSSPDIIKVVHQPNSGHGEGVNQGLRNATGKYFKVVDSDDWLDTRALRRLLDYLEYWDNRGEQVDLVVCN